MSQYEVRQLADELQPPETGKQTSVLADDANTKVVLFVFAAGDGLAEHAAPLPAIIQIIKGEASMTIGDETVAGKPGTWIQMAAKTPHNIKAQKPDIEFNYVSNIGTKWYRKYFYFAATYTCPGPNALTPSFESNFARMENLGAGRFLLSCLRHNSQWVKLYVAQTVYECLKAIKNDAWFTP